MVFSNIATVYELNKNIDIDCGKNSSSGKMNSKTSIKLEELVNKLYL